MRQALVIGATGGVGGATALALMRRDWAVRGLARDPARARDTGPAGVAWVKGDAMREADVMAAAQGTALVFHGANPPNYRDWRGLAIPMLRHAIRAARAAEARLMLPGNLYVFAPEAGCRIAEDAVQAPRTRKGMVRVEMEAMLRAGAAEGLRSLVLRAGDFFGPHAPSSWVTTVLLREGRPLTRVVTPEQPGVGHAWAYLPDLAETFARLADREGALKPCETLQFRGHQLEGRAMAEAAGRVLGGLPVRPFPWWQIALARPFVPFLRELHEMRYLWDETLGLDNARLLALLGEEPHTPLDEAVRASLEALRARAPSR